MRLDSNGLETVLSKEQWGLKGIGGKEEKSEEAERRSS